MLVLIYKNNLDHLLNKLQYQSGYSSEAAVLVDIP